MYGERAVQARGVLHVHSSEACAFCAGTGGSCLIIGSAAGVAAMGLEHINFMWYLRKIAPWALLGYIAGILVYLAQAKITGVL